MGRKSCKRNLASQNSLWEFGERMAFKTRSGNWEKKIRKELSRNVFRQWKKKKRTVPFVSFSFLVRRPRISFLIVKITSANFSLLSIHPFSLPHYAYNDASEVRNFRAYTFFRRFRNARRENQNDAIMVMPSDRDRLDGYGFLSNAACRMRKSHSFKSVAENRTSKKCLADRDLSLIHTMGNYS